MSLENNQSPQIPQSIASKQETTQKSPIDALELESPIEDPWFQHNRVDRYCSQQMWEDLYTKTLERWEKEVLASPLIQSKIADLEKSGENDLKERIEYNIRFIVKNELLRHLDSILSDQTLDYPKVESLVLYDADQLIEKEGLASEMTITQKLIEAGAETRLGNQNPQSLLNEERLVAFIKNASPGFFEGKNKEERLQNLKRYENLFLKGYMAVSYSNYSKHPRAEITELGKGIDAMTDLTFDLNKHYESNEPLKDWPWPAEDDWRLRNLQIQNKLDSIFGDVTTAAGHSYQFAK
jgi:hypothetical protein